MKVFLTYVAAVVLGVFTSVALASSTVITPTFSDVDYDAYYGDAIQHMTYRQIITGYDLNTFGPKDSVSRADLAVILKRYDDRLLSTTYSSGVDNLTTLVCEGFSENNFDTAIADLYQELCVPMDY
jgi:hypothetical protein